MLSYPLYDHLGSTVGESDGVTAAITNQVKYYPFGKERSTIGVLATDKAYTGQQKEPQSGSSLSAYYYGARFYSAALGRFVSPDPLTLDGLNRYAYVRNNPVRFSDPSGYCIFFCRAGGIPKEVIDAAAQSPTGSIPDSKVIEPICYECYEWADAVNAYQAAVARQAWADAVNAYRRGIAKMPSFDGAGGPDSRKECGDLSLCQLKRPFVEAKDTIAGCAHGNFVDDCLTGVQELDLLPFGETCGIAGAVGGGPVGGVVGGTICHAGLEGTIEILSLSASLTQIALADCSRTDTAKAMALTGANTLVGVGSFFSEPIEGRILEEQSDVLDNC